MIIIGQLNSIARLLADRNVYAFFVPAQSARSLRPQSHINRPTNYLFAKMSGNGSLEASSPKVECAHAPKTDAEKRDITGLRKWITDNMLLMLTLLGVSFGVAIGYELRPLKLHTSYITLISYPGEIFMRLLKLLILPLIISSLISGSAGLNARLNGRIALRTLLYFLLTSALNAVLGVVLASLIRPGANSDLKADNQLDSGTVKRNANVLDTLLDLGRNIVPDNIFSATFQQAYTDYVNSSVRVYNDISGDYDVIQTTEAIIRYRTGTNTIGIVVFCMGFGTILGTMGARSRPVIDFFGIMFDVVMRLVTGVIWLTPVGVASVIAGKVLSVQNVDVVVSQLGWFIATVIVGVFIYQLIILQLIYLVMVRRNPFRYYCSLAHGTLTAFATASTAAALPITFTLMEDKLKIDTRITRFVLPIGCNINMDGTALFIAVASVFFAQMNHVTLELGELITVCFAATSASFSSASVPSAALVLLLMVLSSINIPTHDVFILFAVDWLVDRFRTTNNMLGDCYAAAVVEELSRKELMACDAILQESDMQSQQSDDAILVVHRVDQNGATNTI